MSTQEKKEMQEQPYVPFKKIKNWVTKASSILTDDSKVTFEAVMMMWFPTIWDNIQDQMKACFNDGFERGLKMRKGDSNENKGIN